MASLDTHLESEATVVESAVMRLRQHHVTPGTQRESSYALLHGLASPGSPSPLSRSAVDFAPVYTRTNRQATGGTTAKEKYLDEAWHLGVDYRIPRGGA
jgi:hypothetical protein